MILKCGSNYESTPCGWCNNCKNNNKIKNEIVKPLEDKIEFLKNELASVADQANYLSGKLAKNKCDMNYLCTDCGRQFDNPIGRPVEKKSNILCCPCCRSTAFAKTKKGLRADYERELEGLRSKYAPIFVK